MFVVINHVVEGVIGLNGFEYLLDGPDGEIKAFPTKGAAFQFLEEEGGLTSEEWEYIEVIEAPDAAETCQTIKFKRPGDDRVHSFKTDDDLHDTWDEVTIDGEGYSVNVWFDDPDAGILISLYPYVMVDGKWEADYSNFVSCELVNAAQLQINYREQRKKLCENQLSQWLFCH